MPITLLVRDGQLLTDSGGNPLAVVTQTFNSEEIQAALQACNCCGGGGQSACECTGLPDTVYLRRVSDDALLATLTFSAGASSAHSPEDAWVGSGTFGTYEFACNPDAEPAPEWTILLGMGEYPSGETHSCTSPYAMFTGTEEGTIYIGDA